MNPQRNLFALRKVAVKRAVARKDNSVGEQRRKAAEPNLECARLILSDVEANGGSESLAVRWAHLVIDKSLPLT